jgi:hypothetical protein
MPLNSIYDISLAYFNLAWVYFQSDMYIFRQWWLWAPLAIPAVLYFGFFLIKWTLFTFPIWCPFSIIIGAIRRIGQHTRYVRRKKAEQRKQEISAPDFVERKEN